MYNVAPASCLHEWFAAPVLMPDIGSREILTLLQALVCTFRDHAQMNLLNLPHYDLNENNNADLFSFKS